MNRSTWDQAKSLLASAAELPAADRARFVTDHCSDPELRCEVLDLLASPAALSSIVKPHALQTGARLGPYIIDRLLGSGGMGEVYNAHDSTLNRNVAIKVLLNPLADDAGQSARFRREAQVLAALNHPNIAHIYGFEDFSGVAALVMELVEGQTLGERIAHRAIPLAQALPIAIQIADALDAAHTQGIVHRDLKPANVKVREDGTIKVLDFGLGKALDLTASSNANALGSPQSAGATQPGFVLGTAAYMAPEQACGKAADKRADIWSFGCVLYEMLTGRRAFAGNDIADTLSLVMGHDPEWTALPPDTPPPILKVLRRCLEKNRDRRLADIADARFEIEDALSPSIHSSAVITRDRVAPPAGWRRALPWGVAAACGGALALVLASEGPWRRTSGAAPLRLTADLGAGAAVVAFGQAASLALSPDGTEIAFLGLRPSERIPRLYVRGLEHLEAALLPETDGANAPFFSPDGKWIAFFASGKLKKISVTGGAAVTLCDAPNGRGGTWGEDGIIAFSPERQTSLSRVSSSGGTPQPLTTLDAGEVSQRWPQVLPGGKAVLYSSLSPAGDFDFDKGNLVVQPLPTGVRKVVQRGGYYGRYVPSGHLIYLHNGTLFAAAFDPVRLELTGPPRRVVDSVSAGTTSGAGLFAVSNSGALVYVAGGQGSDKGPIGWLDRSGESAILRAEPSEWADLSFAPDGRRFALDVWDGKQWDIWTDDWARNSMERLTTSTTHSQNPVWTPDGRRIVYASQRGEKAVAYTFNLYWQRVDGTGNAQRLTTSENLQVPGSWHPNGKILAFEEQAAHANLMLLPMDGDEAAGWRPGKPTVFASGAFDQRAPTFSPDGRWLAYESDQSGQYEVYVRPFPGPGDSSPISIGGGLFPTWSRTRHELLYSTLDQRIMVVNYSVNRDSFHAEQPRPWPEARYRSQGISGLIRFRSFNLHPDGNRIALAPLGATRSPEKRDRLTIVLNFFDELRRVAPAAER